MAVASQERIEHALRVLSSLENMKSRKFICDFEVKVENKSFHVHQALLATCSEYFEAVLSSNMKEAQEGVITMKDLSATAIERCIEYMYTGSSDLKMDNVEETLLASNFLQMKILEEKCFNLLKKNLTPSNCLHILNLARAFCSQDVEKAAEAVILKNMETVVLSDLFKNISKSDLLYFISRVDHKTSWRALTIWSQDRKREFEDLAERYDFSKLPFEILLSEVVNDPTVNCSERVKTMVHQSLFHDSEKLQRNLNSSNCFSLKRLATDSKSKEIINAFMSKNFSMIMQDQEFCDLSREDVISLLTSPEVASEESKWYAMLKWVRKETQKRRKMFPHLFSSISPEKLPLEFLEVTVRNEELVRKSNACMNILMDAIIDYRKRRENSREEVQHLVHNLQQPPGGKVETSGHFSDKLDFRFESGSFQGVQYAKCTLQYVVPLEKGIKDRIVTAFNQRKLFKLRHKAGSDVGEIVLGDIPLDEKFCTRLPRPSEFRKYAEVLDCELQKKGL